MPTGLDRTPEQDINITVDVEVKGYKKSMKKIKKLLKLARKTRKAINALKDLDIPENDTDPKYLILHSKGPDITKEFVELMQSIIQKEE